MDNEIVNICKARGQSSFEFPIVEIEEDESVSSGIVKMFDRIITIFKSV